MIFLDIVVYIEGISFPTYMAPDKCSFEILTVVMFCQSGGVVIDVFALCDTCRAFDFFLFSLVAFIFVYFRGERCAMLHHKMCLLKYAVFSMCS